MREVILLGERPNLDSSKIRARSYLLSLQDRISSDLPDALQLQLMHKVQLIHQLMLLSEKIQGKSMI